MCGGFFLVTNVQIVSRFGQKRLLNALNANANLQMLEIVENAWIEMQCFQNCA